MKILASLVTLVALSYPSITWGFTKDFLHLDKVSDPKDRKTEHLQSSLTGSPNQLKVKVFLRNFLAKDAEKINQAVKILNTVMNSQEFKQAVLSYTFEGEKRFHKNKGMTNQEIFNHLMTGAEDLMPEVDHIMNFDLTLYRSLNPWSKVKGYTLPDTMRIWMNTRYFKRSSWTKYDVAANMAHEWVHKMGFGHAYENNPDRAHSVPYAIGRIVGDLAKKLDF